MNLNKAHPRQLRVGGFTIVESVMGMMVLGISALALTGGLVSGYQTLRMAQDNQRATQIILDKMEMLRLYSWDQLNTPGFVPRTFTFVDVAPVNVSTRKSAPAPTGITYHGRITMSNPEWSANYGSRVKKVRVELTWTTAGIKRNRELTTLITQDGLYSYIY